MKIQTSMEFIILLVGISAFSIAAIGMYLHFSHSQDSVYYNLLNSTSNISANTAYSSSPPSEPFYVSVYSPSVAYVNTSSSIDVVLYTSNATLDYLDMNSPTLEHTPTSYSGIALNQASVFSFSIVPEHAGYSNVSISIEATGPGGVYHYNKSLQIYSVYAASSGSGIQPNNTNLLPVLSASLYPHSEAVLSSIDSGAGLYQLTEWSHCSYTGFWHHELSIQTECGNAKWYFWIFSSYCYYNSGSSTVTYCVYENPTGASLDSIGTQSTYQYNLTLSLSNSSKNIYLVSSISNSGNTSPILSAINGTRVGNATVSGQISGYASPQDYSYYLLNKSSNYTVVNSSAYSQYMQAYDNLNYVLDYYNDSGIGGSELSTIQQTISSYNKESSAMLDAEAANSPCSVVEYSGKAWYYCKLFSIEFDNITALVDSPLHQNSTTVADGSNIYITSPK